MKTEPIEIDPDVFSDMWRVYSDTLAGITYNHLYRPENDSNCCTAVALAIVHNVSITTAQQILAMYGRKLHRGFPFKGIAERELSLEMMPELSCRRIKTILPELKTGRYCIRTRGHVFSTIDGEIYDISVVKPNAIAQMVYRPIQSEFIAALDKAINDQIQRSLTE